MCTKRVSAQVNAWLAPDPDNLDWQHDVAMAHNSVGDVLVEQGKLNEALRDEADARDSYTAL
jgi:hypothetical protein